MPRVEIKIERNKTVLINLDTIAKSLNRYPICILKHLSYALGTQTSFDKNNKKYTLNGHHDETTIQRNIFNFIKSYVLCRTCNNPETEMVIKRKRTLCTKCHACGNFNRVDGCDKFIKFIMNCCDEKKYL